MTDVSETLVPCPECELVNGSSPDFPDGVLAVADCFLCAGLGLVESQVRLNYRRQSSIPPSLHCDKL